MTNKPQHDPGRLAVHELEPELRDRLLSLDEPVSHADWEDVVSRSPASRVRLHRGRFTRSTTVAGTVVAAVAALALSSSVRAFVGLQSSHHRPELVARVTGAFVHRPVPRYGPPWVTITFTIGEQGKAPGTGIPWGSYFLVDLASRTGAPTSPLLIRAYGTRGHYRVTARLPQGGIGRIMVGGWLNVRKGTSAADGEFWIPVVIPTVPH